MLRSEEPMQTMYEMVAVRLEELVRNRDPYQTFVIVVPCEELQLFTDWVWQHKPHWSLAGGLMPPCQECGQPADGYYYDCSCGKEAWCKSCHEAFGNDSIFAWSEHNDHDCNSDCCATGHRHLSCERDNFYATIPPVGILVDTGGCNDFGDEKFTVSCWIPTQQERDKIVEEKWSAYCRWRDYYRSRAFRSDFLAVFVNDVEAVLKAADDGQLARLQAGIQDMRAEGYPDDNEYKQHGVEEDGTYEPLLDIFFEPLFGPVEMSFLEEVQYFISHNRSSKPGVEVERLLMAMQASKEYCEHGPGRSYGTTSNPVLPGIDWDTTLLCRS